MSSHSPAARASYAAVTCAVLATVAIHAWAAHRSWWSPPVELTGGTIQRGTLERLSGSRVRFVIVVDFSVNQALWDRGEVEVQYTGELPDTVCERAAVAIDGRVLGDHLEAVQLEGWPPARYDPCWRWRCLPLDEYERRCPRARTTPAFR